MKKYTNEELNIISGGKVLNPDCKEKLAKKHQTGIKPVKEEINIFEELKDGGLGVNIVAGVAFLIWFTAALEFLKEVIEHQNIDIR